METADRENAIKQLTDLLNSGHWMGNYIVDLLKAAKPGAGMEFEAAEALLSKERQTFEHDLAVARKMYQLYPHAVNSFL
jgi:hypothetical protein